MEGGPPSFPPGFTCPAVLWILAGILRFSLTGLSPALAGLPIPFTVCPLPRSLATTSGISVDFSSSPYLDVSVQAVPHVRLFCSTHVDRVLLCRVSPFGNSGINAYVRLPQTYRSLSRPSSALDAKAFPLRSYQLDLVEAKSIPFGTSSRIFLTSFPCFSSSSRTRLRWASLG